MKLIVLRGASGSGKSTVATLLRQRLGTGIALVEQDYLGRVVLGLRATDDGTSADALDALARAALRTAPAVLVEGILSSERYGAVIEGLRGIPGVSSWLYRFRLPFEETVARHATREKAGSFGEDELRRWWPGDDLLRDHDGRPVEQLIGPGATAEQVAERIIADAGLVAGD
ncbi:AAA family ATPase [Leifsonia sp. 22587]|uniref:AAA family ATPase n=1 Tax=Leifsonia sp. 22587 TaxID=3453946 RepID=UPI003F875218